MLIFFYNFLILIQILVSRIHYISIYYSKMIEYYKTFGINLLENEEIWLEINEIPILWYIN